MLHESLNKKPRSELGSFSERLRWALDHHGEVHTQAELARRMKVSPSYIAELASRETPPGKKTLGRISKILNITEGWLAYGEVPPDDLVTEERRLSGKDTPRDLSSSVPEVWMRYDAIEASDLPELMKLYKTEALAALLRARAQERDAAAAEARARRMEVEVELDTGPGGTRGGVKAGPRRPAKETPRAPRSGEVKKRAG